MTIEFWLGVSALVTVLAIVLIGSLELFGFGWRSVVQKFWCPFQHRFVVVKFRSTPFSTSYTDVLSCSALEEDSRSSCEKRCLGSARRT